MADEVVHILDLEPAIGFGGFEFEAGDALERMAGQGDYSVVGVEFLGEVDGVRLVSLSKRAETALMALVRMASYCVSVSRMARRDLMVANWVNMVFGS